MKADGSDIIQVTARLLDADGHPAQDQEIHCQVLGDLCLLGLENGIPDDLTPYSENHRRTREGSLTAYLRAGEIAGKAAVHLWTDSGLTADLKLILRK